MTKEKVFTITLEPADNKRLAILLGPFDSHLKQIENRVGVSISYRGNEFRFTGEFKPCARAQLIVQQLYNDTAIVKNKYGEVDAEKVHLAIQENCSSEADDYKIPKLEKIKTKRGVIKARNNNQAIYMENIIKHDICFGIGPAGTGKTYIAVAAAVEALERQEIRRILLTRPAVEAGEKLGFLPGDLSQKVDPYLRPLYDALFEMLGFEKVEKLIEKSIIEIAPLAYMRGRTLNDAFIILDESQNTTPEQMKMFLTRIGFNSKAVITGDITQIDLPKHQKSGLKHVMTVLENIPMVSFNFFTSGDVVRHPVVAKIVEAYEAYELKDKRYES